MLWPNIPNQRKLTGIVHFYETHETYYSSQANLLSSSTLFLLEMNEVPCLSHPGSGWWIALLKSSSSWCSINHQQPGKSFSTPCYLDIATLICQIKRDRLAIKYWLYFSRGIKYIHLLFYVVSVAWQEIEVIIECLLFICRSLRWKMAAYKQKEPWRTSKTLSLSYSSSGRLWCTDKTKNLRRYSAKN